MTDQPSGLPERETGASRKLDAMIAERVMGWVWQRFDFAPAGYDGPNGHLLAPWCWLVREPVRAGRPSDGTETRFIGNVPHYSSDIAAAFSVVEAMRAKGWDLKMSWVASPGPGAKEPHVLVQFANAMLGSTRSAYATAPARAIAIAAIEAAEAHERAYGDALPHPHGSSPDKAQLGNS